MIETQSFSSWWSLANTGIIVRSQKVVTTNNVDIYTRDTWYIHTYLSSGVPTRCLSIWCCLKLEWHLKASPQCSHSNGLSDVCVDMCFIRSYSFTNPFSKMIYIEIVVIISADRGAQFLHNLDNGMNINLTRCSMFIHT